MLCISKKGKFTPGYTKTLKAGYDSKWDLEMCSLWFGFNMRASQTEHLGRIKNGYKGKGQAREHVACTSQNVACHINRYPVLKVVYDCIYLQSLRSVEAARERERGGKHIIRTSSSLHYVQIDQAMPVSDCLLYSLLGREAQPLYVRHTQCRTRKYETGNLFHPAGILVYGCVLH